MSLAFARSEDLKSVPCNMADEPADGLHISTLASSGYVPGPIIWGKSTPIRTYSKKSASPLSSPPPSRTPDSDGGETNRSGRTRKPRISGDFVSTDKRISQYLAGRPVENAAIHTISEASRSTPLSMMGFGYGRSYSRAQSVPPASKSKVPVITNEEPSNNTSLDLEAPRSPVTLEKPLLLQECESDAENVPSEPSEYALGDLCWAAVPRYPYWPAIVTRDPITDSIVKTYSGNKRTMWHVHFFGERDMRAWISSRNMFKFDGMGSYNNEKERFTERLGLPSKKSSSTKNSKSPFVIPNNYVGSWNTAFSEALKLLSSDKLERLEALHSKHEQLKMRKRSRSLSLMDLDMIVPRKKARKSEPPKKNSMNISSTTFRFNSVFNSASPPSSRSSTPAPEARKSVSPKKNIINIATSFSSINGVINSALQPLIKSSTTPSELVFGQTTITLDSKAFKTSPVKNELESNTSVEVSTVLQVGAKIPLGSANVLIPGLNGVKRKRGRPFKYSRSSLDAVASQPAVNSKNISPTTSATDELGLNGVKRKRGRPFKHTRSSLDAVASQPAVNLNKISLKTLATDEPVLIPKEKPRSLRQQPLRTKRRSAPDIQLIESSNVDITAQRSSRRRSVPTSISVKDENKLKHKPSRIKEEPISSTPLRKSLEKMVSPRATPKTKKNEVRPKCQDEAYDDSSSNKDSEASHEKESQSMKPRALFDGAKDIKVCCICLEGRNVVRCRGPCNLHMHVECSDKPRFVPEPGEKPRGVVGRKRKEGQTPLKIRRASTLNTPEIKKEEHAADDADSKSDEETVPGSSTIPTPPPEEDKSDPLDTTAYLGMHDVSHEIDTGFQRDSAESTTSETSDKDKNSDDKKEGKEKRWLCQLCIDNGLGPCFVCGRDEGNRLRCKAAGCGKVYHLECAREWPQHILTEYAKGKLRFECPAHACHTCISDNPAVLAACVQHRKLVRCLRCPTTYHHGDKCVPAGSQILSSTQMVCPRHHQKGRKSLGLANLRYCNLCRNGGSLICCDLCPFSAHVECLDIPVPEGAYICLECQTGRFPLFGEIVWAKLGLYRWWPARIVYPYEIPPSLLRFEKEKIPGEFVVKFYGTNDFYWLHRGRVFPFDEPDFERLDTSPALRRRATDYSYRVGVQEAVKDFILWTEQRSHLKESQRIMKVPKYVKITTNKPVGSVKITQPDSAREPDACECTLEQKDPCGPESSCLNRVICVECSPRTCPAGNKCRNQNFEKRLSPPLTLFPTESTGWGVKADVPLKRGDFIIEYVGEMIDVEEFKRRLGKVVQSKTEGFYFLTLEKDIMLDAGPKGNLSRFMNHSCEPNCQMEKWTVAGNTRIGIFAVQDIPAGTELVFDYNFMNIGDSGIVCKCRAPNCRGFIGPKPIGKSTPKTITKQPATKPIPKPVVQPAKSVKQRPTKRKTKSLSRSKSLVKVALTNSTTEALESSSDKSIKCFVCQEFGATITCTEPLCKKTFHLTCMGLTKDPPKRWTCPSHECSVCRSPNQVEHCSICINSYCNQHQDGFLVLSIRGSYCHNHNLTDSGSEWSTGENEEREAQTEGPDRQQSQLESSSAEELKQRATERPVEVAVEIPPAGC